MSGKGRDSAASAWIFRSAMIDTGIDDPKRCSVACTLHAHGRRLKEARSEANAPEGFKDDFASLGGASDVIIEACWNRATLHDVLEKSQGVAKVVVSHPAKNRIIAEAQIRNDSIDAKALATLLRGDFVSRIHAPSRDERNRKLMVRQRLWLDAVAHTPAQPHPHRGRSPAEAAASGLAIDDNPAALRPFVVAGDGHDRLGDKSTGHDFPQSLVFSLRGVLVVLNELSDVVVHDVRPMAWLK